MTPTRTLLLVALLGRFPQIARTDDAGERARRDYLEAQRILDSGGDAEQAVRHLRSAREALAGTNPRLQALLVKALHAAGRHEDVVREARVFLGLGVDAELVVHREVTDILRRSERVLEQRRVEAEAERRRQAALAAQRRREFEAKWGATAPEAAQAAHARARDAHRRNDPSTTLSLAQQSDELAGRAVGENAVVRIWAHRQLNQPDGVVRAARDLDADRSRVPRDRFDSATPHRRWAEQRIRERNAHLANVRAAPARRNRALASERVNRKQANRHTARGLGLVGAMGAGVAMVGSGLYVMSQLEEVEDNREGRLLGAVLLTSGGVGLVVVGNIHAKDQFRWARGARRSADRYRQEAEREERLIRENPEAFQQR
jgi:hypothetical protein